MCQHIITNNEPLSGLTSRIFPCFRHSAALSCASQATRLGFGAAVPVTGAVIGLRDAAAVAGGLL